MSLGDENAPPTSIISKKLGANLFLSVKMNSPFHNVRMNALEVQVTDGAIIKLVQKYTCSCLCEPCGIASTRSNTYEDGTVSLNDNYIDPSTRISYIQRFLEMKEVMASDSGSRLKMKLQGFGANPGRTNIKFIVLVFQIDYQNEVYHTYVTMKIHKKCEMVGHNEKRGFSSISTCFVSGLINEDDPFLVKLKQSKLESGSSGTFKPYEPTTRKKTPQRTKKGTTVTDDAKFNDYLDGNANQLQTQSLNNNLVPIKLIEDYPDPKMDDVFSEVVAKNIHFVYGPKTGGQPNALYLAFKDTTKKGLLDLFSGHLASVDIRFVPKHDENVQIGIPQIVHISGCGVDGVVVNFITPSVLESNVEGDIDTYTFITMNEEVLETNIEYTFYDQRKMMQSNDVELLNYSQVDSNPTMTVVNIGQLFYQQWQQSKEEYGYDKGLFTENFQLQFGSIIDIFGFNFAGFLKFNNFNIQGIEFKDITYPDSVIDVMDSSQSTSEPQELRNEEKVVSAEDATNSTVEYISSRISWTSDILTSSVEVLAHKMSTKDTKEALTWIGNHIISQKYLDTFYNPGKRHARNDKVPYLNLKLVIYDSAAIPSQETQNITPKLKVALFFAKFVISFDEATHMIVIEDQEKKENFLYQTFYDCNIYTVRKSDEIDQFLSKLAQFNCSWNGTQFYDDENSNTGHYVISALKFMGIWDSNQLWAKLATNVCERKPLEKYVVVNPDFFHMDSKSNIPAMLGGEKAASCSRLKLALTDYIKSQTDAPFRYTFSGYSQDPEFEAQLARSELEFFCELLSKCGDNYLRNMEDGVRVQRLLKKIMQTNYGQSITPQTWTYLKPLSDKHNQTFHKQMYNFPGFYKLVNPTPESQNLEKNIAQIWDSVQQDRMVLN